MMTRMCSCRVRAVKRRTSFPCDVRRLRLALLHHLPRARQPQQRVDAGDHERADQQRGHEPERVEQDRVLVPVVMRRVRQIAGELPMRAGMALPAGLDDVLARQMRGRVVRRQDVVRAMAVVALGGGGEAELRHLAVERLEVALRDVLVTAAALVEDGELEALAVRARDLVRGVAVGAMRQRLVAFVDQRRVDARSELLVDAVVTLRAGRSDVVRVDGRALVAGGQLAMRRVAIGAHRRHDQPALHQALAVDALDVALHDVVLIACVSDRRLLALAVALAAQVRHVHGERGGLRILVAARCCARRDSRGRRAHWCRRAPRACRECWWRTP